MELQVEDSAVEALLALGGFDPTLGARPMKRSIARLLEAPLAEKILKGEVERPGRNGGEATKTPFEAKRVKEEEKK